MRRRILLTGVSGTGKSTLVRELAARGYRAVDADEDGMSEEVAVSPGELTGLGDGRDWVWNEERIAAVLAEEGADVLFISGCSPNQGKFYPQLDRVILLTAPPELIAERLATRTDNPFGKDPGQLARVLQLKDSVEPLLRRGAHAEVDTSGDLSEVVETVLQVSLGMDPSNL